MPQSDQPQNPNIDPLLYPRSTYRGEFTPKNLVFNANLQEFAQRISYICALETNGKLTATEAYEQVKHLYKDLKRSKKGLGIGEGSPPQEPSQ